MTLLYRCCAHPLIVAVGNVRPSQHRPALSPHDRGLSGVGMPIAIGDQAPRRGQLSLRLGACAHANLCALRIEEVRGPTQLSIGPEGPISLPRDGMETLALLLSRGLLCADRDDHAMGRPLIY